MIACEPWISSDGLLAGYLNPDGRVCSAWRLDRTVVDKALSLTGGVPQWLVVLSAKDAQDLCGEVRTEGRETRNACYKFPAKHHHPIRPLSSLWCIGAGEVELG